MTGHGTPHSWRWRSTSTMRSWPGTGGAGRAAGTCRPTRPRSSKRSRAGSGSAAPGCRPARAARNARTTTCTVPAAPARSSSVRCRRAGATACAAGAPRASVVPQRLDQLVLAHVRASLDADLAGALLEVVLRPVVVGRRAAALLGGRAAAVGDPGGLLLALSLVAQGLVLLGVLDARAGIALRHRALLRVVLRCFSRPTRNRRPGIKPGRSRPMKGVHAPSVRSWKSCCPEPARLRRAGDRC